MSLFPSSPEILPPKSCEAAQNLGIKKKKKLQKQASLDVSAGRFYSSLVFMCLHKQPDDVENTSDGHARD